MLLNILWCPGQLSPTKNHPASSINNAEGANSAGAASRVQWPVRVRRLLVESFKEVKSGILSL